MGSVIFHNSPGPPKPVPGMYYCAIKSNIIIIIEFISCSLWIQVSRMELKFVKININAYVAYPEISDPNFCVGKVLLKFYEMYIFQH